MLRNRKHVLCFYRVIEIQVEVWENEKCCGNGHLQLVLQEMLWEHKSQASVSSAFFSSPKLSWMFLYLDRNSEYMFSISFRKHQDKEKENNLLTLIIKI